MTYLSFFYFKFLVLEGFITIMKIVERKVVVFMLLLINKWYKTTHFVYKNILFRFLGKIGEIIIVPLKTQIS